MMYRFMGKLSVTCNEWFCYCFDR